MREHFMTHVLSTFPSLFFLTFTYLLKEYFIQCCQGSKFHCCHHLVVSGRLCNHTDDRSLDASPSVSLWVISADISLPTGVRGSVTDPFAPGVMFPVQPAPSPQNRCLATGTQAAHWSGEVSWRMCYFFLLSLT